MGGGDNNNNNNRGGGDWGEARKKEDGDGGNNNNTPEEEEVAGEMCVCVCVCVWRVILNVYMISQSDSLASQSSQPFKNFGSCKMLHLFTFPKRTIRGFR